MANKQKCVDIVGGVLPAVMMQNTGTAGKAHGSKTVILGNDDVTGVDPADQGIVHTVGTFVENKGLGAIPMEFVGSVAQQKAGNRIFSAYRNSNIYYGAGICVDQNFHDSHL